jgi:hypothetical protein
MRKKMPTAATKLLVALFIAAFTFIACNNQNEEKKETQPEQATEQPAQGQQEGSDTTKLDTADTRPVKTPN